MELPSVALTTLLPCCTLMLKGSGGGVTWARARDAIRTAAKAETMRAPDIIDRPPPGQSRLPCLPRYRARRTVRQARRNLVAIVVRNQARPSWRGRSRGQCGPAKRES